MSLPVVPLVLPVLLTLAAFPWVMSQPPEVTHRPPGNKNECLPGWLPILFGCLLLFATWMSNCTLLGGVFQVMADPGVVRVAYYFVGSQIVASLIYATLNLPPGLLILLFGSTSMSSYLGIFCLFSTYLDTLFCNLALLHAFCSGLDSYFRLSRQRNGFVSTELKPGRQATLWLKISSPWFVSGILAIAQLAVSDRGLAHLSEDCHRQFLPQFTNQLEATCIVTEPNFLILRTSIAYALPLIGCLILTGLQVRCLRKLRFVPPDYSLKPRNRPAIQRDVTLETLAPLPEAGKPSSPSTLEKIHECPRHGRIAYDSETVIHEDSKRYATMAIPMNRWFQSYRAEQLAVAINMVSCIVAVGIWSPLILSSLAYGLCHTPENVRSIKQPLYHIPGVDLSMYRPARCFIQVAASRLADFRWWVYASTGLLLPIALLLMDRDLRRACWRSLGWRTSSTVNASRKGLRRCEMATHNDNDDTETTIPSTSNTIH
ncbi:hypothetical protein Aperf_G00000037246 [Anoplocephala perfoliata]